MASPATIDFTDGDSGFVRKVGLSTYSIGTGASNCKIEKNSTTQVDQRAVFRFPVVGKVPKNANISLVEFFNQFSTAQPGTPPNSSTTVLGAWCGASLDASNNDWAHSGATDLGIAMHAQSDATWVDLSSGSIDPTTLINLIESVNSGYTDLMIIDQSIALGTTGCNWNTAKSKCKLRITYTLNDVLQDVIIEGVVIFPRP